MAHAPHVFARLIPICKTVLGGLAFAAATYFVALAYCLT
jgi:hypothetical protein